MTKLHYFEGMKLHGDNACKYHSFEKYEPLKHRNEPTMFWLYQENDYKLLANHQGKKFVFWHNADVPGLMRVFSKYIPVVRDPSIIHVCHNELLRDELASMGIYSLIRPIFWGDASKYVPTNEPLTKDCYMTANKGRGVEYGEMIMNALAWRFPDWTFHIFGIDPTIPVYCDNVKYYGWITEDEMDEIDKNFMVCFRFNQHDGFSQTVMKARMRGQIAITSIHYGSLTAHYDSFELLMTFFKPLQNLIKRNPTEEDRTRYLYLPIEQKVFTNLDFLK